MEKQSDNLKSYRIIQVLAIFIISCGLLFTMIKEVIPGVVFTMLGCCLMHRRANKIAADRGQESTQPLRRHWQIGVIIGFIVCFVIGLFSADTISQITVSSAPSALSVPDAQEIVFSYEPIDAGTSSLVCESSDTSIAVVELKSAENGKVNCVVTPIAAGDVAVTCRTGAVDGSTVNMTVTDPVAEEVARKAAEEEAARKAAEEEAARKAAEEEAARKAAEEEAARKAAEEEAARKAAEEEAARKAAEEAAAKKAAEEKQNAPASSGSLVGSIESDKYHYPSCRWVKKILPENKIWFSSDAEAKSKGYSPCGTCH